MMRLGLCVLFLGLALELTAQLRADSYLLRQDRMLVEDTGKCTLPFFIREDDNVLRGDAGSLEPFWEKLRLLKKYNGTEVRKVRIVHIGDSHLQAGYLNGTVMRRFHADFGNAGRGLVVPLKLSRTNEPIDYDITSDIDWNAARCLSKKPPYPVGIGGISIVPRTAAFHLEVQIPPAEADCYRFNRVDVYHLPGAAVLKPCRVGVEMLPQAWPFMTSYCLDKPCDRLTFEGHTSCPDSSVYYGFNLENGQDGVLYHAIGINGAQYTHYQNISHFAGQVSSLEPDLVIFSLGTNEAFRGGFSEAYIRHEMDALILEIRRANPDAVILLTTPAECQWKVRRNGGQVYQPNPYIQPIAGTIISYAVEHGFAYWDLFGMSGGSGSSENWIEGRFLARDRIHFGVSGYRLQGNMLYNALMKGYNEYVRQCRARQEQKEQEDGTWWKKMLFPSFGVQAIDNVFPGE